MSPETERIILVLRTTLRVLGFSLREIERRMDLSASYLSRLFAGKVELKVDHVVEISRAMEVDPAEVFQMALFPASTPRSEIAARVQYALAAFPVPSAAGGSLLEPPGLPTTSTPTPAPPSPPAAKQSVEELEDLMTRALRRFFTDTVKSKTD